MKPLPAGSPPTGSDTPPPNDDKRSDELPTIPPHADDDGLARLAQLRTLFAPELELVRLVGRGQMASVYLAREVALRRFVAVKLLRPELASDPVARARFEREAQSSARITHRNVVSVHRIGRLPDGSPWLVMEYVDGRNLGDMLRAEGAPEIAMARALLAQVAEALAAAHVCDVVHRDLRPENVLLDRSGGRAVLTDFGLAGIAESGAEAVTRLTRDGERIGDRRYMSPEQLHGTPLTTQTDVYSLGVVGYELFTLQLPFRTESVADPATAALRQAPRRLSALRSDVPHDIEDLLRRCLSMQPEHRPRAGEVARLLRAGGADTPLREGAPAPGALEEFIAELKRRRVLGEAFAYLVVAFALLQGADLALPALGAPPRIFNMLVLVVLGAFPVFVAFAWAYDIRRERALATPALPEERTGRMRGLAFQVAGLAVSVILVVALGWWYLR